MTHWSSLTQEIRDIILGCVFVHDHIAPYAPVSIEWRDAIEKKTFRHLHIQVSSSDTRYSAPEVFQTLSQLRNRHQRLVKHIWLNVELVPGGFDPSWNVDMCISVAITWLFRALQFWPAQNDLTLEINEYYTAYYSAPWFRGHHIGGPGEQDGGMPLSSDSRLESFDMPSHNSLMGLFEFLDFKLQRCPSVEAVTKFLRPRQCRRRFKPDTLSCILERLPQLEEISLETWDVSEIYGFNCVEMCATSLFLQPDSFRNVKSMTVFQDRNEYFNAVARHHIAEFQRRIQPQSRPTPPDKVPWHRPVLARELAVASLSLENLSLSFLVDAVDFFGQCRENWLWADLRSLTLTSRLLTCEGDSFKMHGLLKTVAQMAKRMPKLERLTVWNGGANEACAFTYRKQRLTASVTWQAKGGTQLNPAVYRDWENLHSECFFEVEEKDTWPLITSHAAAIMCLGLEHVVNDVSLRQMQLENSIPWSNI
ncbi:uncharacterized protein FFUJ_12397 [Fusarium fujikuroi IMI 58289]|uniref:DUF6546 domain-containing protein n=1 Tax=Gibberella fujikuroi (strain CBS 195.34 / IMI 58289 / NRRL A-6831) TaxID=1279085 RepID=S0ED31_GIBF5|nr:uncharacterized protein FFUJ_12397 [Fusarium fujikuroi IMI 58289]CCT72520.1 uncharacterized protein FFUJ_12397 [Fusarium fujikuroi IMI 58289]